MSSSSVKLALLPFGSTLVAVVAGYLAMFTPDQVSASAFSFLGLA